MKHGALLHALAVGFAIERRGARLMLAESCTGGLASSWLTEIAGSSHWFDGAVVSYSNAVKSDVLGVRDVTLRVHGAVSRETATEMAEGLKRLHRKALARHSVHHAQEELVAAAITGVAGPTGATPGKPLGIVCFSWSGPWGTHTEERDFGGDRSEIRHLAAIYCLSGLLARLSAR